MAKKNKPIITHTEILNRAIRSIEEDIEDIRLKCESIPQAQRDSMFDMATEELKAKLDVLKALYYFETGNAYGNG